MTQFAIPVLFYILALAIHGVPALSVLAPAKIPVLYGFSAGDGVLLTLLHHRAVLFALICAACIYAAHVPSARWPVLIGTSASMASFMVIALIRGQASGPLSKIIYVDGLGLIVAALIALLLLRNL